VLAEAAKGSSRSAAADERERGRHTLDLVFAYPSGLRGGLLQPFLQEKVLDFFVAIMEGVHWLVCVDDEVEAMKEWRGGGGWRERK
jgi:hypothetical protein